MNYDKVPLTAITPDPSNVRQYFSQDSIEELAESIRKYGLLENLVVREGPMGYLLVAGERRYRALCELVKTGFRTQDEEVMVVVIEGRGTFENLVENLQRKDVSAWDLGMRFKELTDAGYTQSDIAFKCGRTQGYVSRHLTIANGLHPACHDKLNQMRTTLTLADLMRVSSLKTEDGRPCREDQFKLIEELAGTRRHRKRRKAPRTDTQKLVRRVKHLSESHTIPRHAEPYVRAVLNYLQGKTKKVMYPDEL